MRSNDGTKSGLVKEIFLKIVLLWNFKGVFQTELLLKSIGV